MNKKVIEQIGEEEQDEQFIPLQDVPAYIQGLCQRIAELEAENERLKEDHKTLRATVVSFQGAHSSVLAQLAEAKRLLEVAREALPYSTIADEIKTFLTQKEKNHERAGKTDSF